MYINPFANKLHADEPGRVLENQLVGWVYESHAWVVKDKVAPNIKVCDWCGAKSTIDMIVDDETNEKALCPKNPVVALAKAQAMLDSRVV